MPPSLFWLSSLLASFVHFLLSFFSTSLWLAHLGAPSISSLPPPHWSLPADVLCCPPAQHYLSIPQGTLERVPKVGKRHTETDHVAARQFPKRETLRQRESSARPSFLTDQRNLPHLCHSGDRKGRSGKFSFLIPQESEPSILNFSL